jgi:Ca-activated chloride channel homolog
MVRRCDSGTALLLAAAAFGILISLTRYLSPQQVNTPPPPKPDQYRISVDVGLVVLPVIVTDKRGLAVPGLAKDSFQVFEDGRPQQIALFEPEDVPVTVGLVVDNSGSMRAKRPEVVAAGQAFAQSSNPQDQMFVVNFNQEVHLGLPQGVDYTNNVQLLQGALTRLPAMGNTALYDAVATALDHLKVGTATRKALIVISDGGDNASKLSLRDLLKKAAASNAQIHALGVFSENYSDEHPEVLSRLAKMTGGKAYFPASAREIPGICQQIAQDLRHQYTIGYHPSNRDSGSKYHAIRVTARNAEDRRLRVRTRAGYLMSSVGPQAALITDRHAPL